MLNRSAIINKLKSQPEIQVLIVGGGINGIGTLRDLALNGVEALLIDKGDYCSGASSASSHMAHGGIRYLENGEFRLVQEAVRERNRMIENAPHRVQPLPTTVPMFKTFSGLLSAPLKFINLLDRPSERGALVIKIGLMVYDSYTRKQKTVPRHQFYFRADSMRMYPKLNPAVKYTATYFDGQILSPERYSIDLIRDASAEGDHAMALNYARAVSANGNEVVIKDEITGESFLVKPKVIINAAGPWIDLVNDSLGVKERYIGGTKGSHLVLDVPELREAIGDHEFFFENKDGRIVLIFPFYDKVIVGTSDLPVNQVDDVTCSEEEEQYFIDLVSRIFPSIRIHRENIIFKFSGVRPLEYSKAKTTGQITRDHSIKYDSVGEIPVLSLVGGKWTSYRAFSAQVCDETLKLLGMTRIKGTEELKVTGGENYPNNAAEKTALFKRISDETGFSEEYAEALFVRYGTAAIEIARQSKEISPSQLASVPNWTLGEVVWLIQHENVLHLEDLFIRRSSIAWLGQLSKAALFEFGAILSKELNWDEDTKAKEIELASDIMVKKHGVRL